MFIMEMRMMKDAQKRLDALERLHVNEWHDRHKRERWIEIAKKLIEDIEAPHSIKRELDSFGAYKMSPSSHLQKRKQRLLTMIQDWISDNTQQEKQPDRSSPKESTEQSNFQPVGNNTDILISIETMVVKNCKTGVEVPCETSVKKKSQKRREGFKLLEAFLNGTTSLPKEVADKRTRKRPNTSGSYGFLSKKRTEANKLLHKIKSDFLFSTLKGKKDLRLEKME